MKEHSKFQLRYTIIITMVFFIVFSTSTVLFVLACEKKYAVNYLLQPACAPGNTGTPCSRITYSLDGNEFNATCENGGINCWTDCVDDGEYDTNGVWHTKTDKYWIRVTVCSKTYNRYSQVVDAVCINNQGTNSCAYDTRLCTNFNYLLPKKIDRFCIDSK